MVQATQRKGKRKQTPAQKASTDAFAATQALIKRMHPEQIVAAHEGTVGTAYMPRDWLMACVYGTAHDAAMSNGQQLWERRTLALAIQPLLNIISSTPGTMLVRGPMWWQVLTPGALGQVITSAGPGNLPYYADIPPDTAAAPVLAIEPAMISFAGPNSAVDGAMDLFLLQSGMTIYEIWEAYGNVPSTVLEGGIVTLTLSGSTYTIATVTPASNTASASDNGVRWAKLTMPTGTAYTAGTYIGVYTQRLKSGALSSLGNYDRSGLPLIPIPVQTIGRYAYATTAIPAVGNTIASTSIASFAWMRAIMWEAS